MIVWVYAFHQSATLMDIFQVAVQGKHKVTHREFRGRW